LETCILAVAIEFVNVIVRKSAAEKNYPGGLDGLARLDLPNYLEDEHLVRVGYMSTREALGFAERLEAVGLRFSENGESDIAVITWSDPETPLWLSVGECEGRGACWLRECSPGKLIDFDPCMMLRWAASAFPSVKEVVRVLRECDAEVRECGRSTEGPATVLLDCAREGAQIEVEVFKDSDDGRPIGVSGRRILARRTFIADDQALMRDLTAALVRAGAEDLSGRP
jgi:hypothetical protein